MKYYSLLPRAFMRHVSVGLFAGLLLCGPVWADKDAIEYRQKVYSAIGAQMGAMGAVLKGKVPHTDDLPVLAAGLSNLAGLLPDLFPEGSGRGDTEALSIIWDEYDDFMQHMSDMRVAADALALVDASDKRSFGQAFQKLGGTCKACHDKFKAE